MRGRFGAQIMNELRVGHVIFEMLGAFEGRVGDF